jgi:hypothetical protein
MEQNLSSKNYEILNWALILALVMNIVFRIIFLYQNWSLSEVEKIGYIIWIIVFISCCWGIYRKVSINYAIVGLIFAGFLLESATANDFWARFSSGLLLNTVKLLDALAVIILAIYIWGKLYKFKIAIKKDENIINK